MKYITSLKIEPQTKVESAYYIYLLKLEDIPIYIGCTRRVLARIREHRNNARNFDECIILCRIYGNKKLALEIEKLAIAMYSQNHKLEN